MSKSLIAADKPCKIGCNSGNVLSQRHWLIYQGVDQLVNNCNQCKQLSIAFGRWQHFFFLMFGFLQYKS